MRTAIIFSVVVFAFGCKERSLQHTDKNDCRSINDHISIIEQKASRTFSNCKITGKRTNPKDERVLIIENYESLNDTVDVPCVSPHYHHLLIGRLLRQIRSNSECFDKIITETYLTKNTVDKHGNENADELCYRMTYSKPKVWENIDRQDSLESYTKVRLYILDTMGALNVSRAQQLVSLFSSKRDFPDEFTDMVFSCVLEREGIKEGSYYTESLSKFYRYLTYNDGDIPSDELQIYSELATHVYVISRILDGNG